MSLQIGLVGLPNAGKSTLFNALTRADVPTAPYPFTTIEPNVGIVTVPDDRLTSIAKIIEPDRVVPTTIEFVDIAGLVKDAHLGEGLGSQFLGHIRNVDAIGMVIRCFQDEEVPHPAGELDPVGDVETLTTELMLEDLATVERRLEKLKIQSKGQPKAFASEVALLERIRQLMGAGRPLRQIELSESDMNTLNGYNLLTAKPMLLIANIGEQDLPYGSLLSEQLCKTAKTEDVVCVVLAAGIEAELLALPKDDADEYREMLGLQRPGLNRLIEASYQLLKLLTFFTMTGGHEVRAWTVPLGTSVSDAAGKIHTDMQRGFIRAEIVSYGDLVAAGALHRAREQGRLRTEGKNYIVQDGDVVHIRFNV